MKIIRNNIIPFPGFKAINLFGVLFVRKGAYISDETINHEMIHSRQMRELLYIGFYVWYVVEWIVRLFMYGFDTHVAYRYISFEREAYTNERNMEYLNERKRYSWFKDYM